LPKRANLFLDGNFFNKPGILKETFSKRAIQFSIMVPECVLKLGNQRKSGIRFRESLSFFGSVFRFGCPVAPPSRVGVRPRRGHWTFNPHRGGGRTHWGRRTGISASRWRGRSVAGPRAGLESLPEGPARHHDGTTSRLGSLRPL